VSDRFELSELQVLEVTGIAAKDLKEIRQSALFGDEHFVRKPRGFFYSEDGLKAILATLGARGVRIPDAAEKNAPAGGQADPLMAKTADLVVERCCPNPIWVQCRHDGALVNVRVMDNRRLVRGTRLAGCVFSAGRWAWDARRRA
jgi:hypothetical protein